MKFIDVSEYQGNIDFAKVKAAGIDGVLLRCGFSGWGSSHSLNKDKNWEKNYKAAKAAGMNVGAYYYSTADTTDFAGKEADFVKKLVSGKQLELPIYYDVENNERQGKLSKDSLTQIAVTFCERMEDAGYFVGVYANTSWFTTKLDHAKLSTLYTIWLADYRGNNANKTLKRDIWQYSSQGRIDGIGGSVDLNECYRDLASIIKGAGLNGFSKKTQSKPTVNKTYRVKAGDSFWSIAEKQLGSGMKMYDLAKANGMTISSVIHPGQVLKLP